MGAAVPLGNPLGWVSLPGLDASVLLGLLCTSVMVQRGHSTGENLTHKSEMEAAY